MWSFLSDLGEDFVHLLLGDDLSVSVQGVAQVAGVHDNQED